MDNLRLCKISDFVFVFLLFFKFYVPFLSFWTHLNQFELQKMFLPSTYIGNVTILTKSLLMWLSFRELNLTKMNSSDLLYRTDCSFHNKLQKWDCRLEYKNWLCSLGHFYWKHFKPKWNNENCKVLK